MSYQNFIPTVWAEGIERQLSQLNVFVEDCHREYEGKVKKVGEAVKINGIGRPTVHNVTRENRNNNIPAVETLEDYSILMPIDQMLVINYKIDDIDEAQAKDGIMAALQGETSEALNDEIDSYVAGLAKDSTVKKLDYFSATEKKISAANVLTALDDAFKTLIKNNVKTSSKIVATVDPDFYIIFKNKYLNMATDNVAEFKNGKVGTYNTMTIKMSNNVAKDGANSLIMVRTKKAIAFARPFTHLEAYRPESGFADAIKGYTIFGAKVIRPKEIVVIKAAY